MSLSKTAALLYQYNADMKKKLIDSLADQQTKFVTESYANPYDEAYEELSNTLNFDNRMWEEAAHNGELDQYVSLLRANKNRQLPAQFYDDNYYDYQTKMLELYTPFADTEKTEERFTQEHNPTTGIWDDVSLGEMNEQQWLRYQLDNEYARKAAEIKLEEETIAKENMSFWEKAGATILGTVYELGEGLLSALAGAADFVIAPFAAMGAWGDDDPNTTWGDAYVNYYGEQGLLAQEKESIRAQLDEYNRLNTYLVNVDGTSTTIGGAVAGISNSIGMMIPSIVLTTVTGGAYAGVSATLFYTSIYSNNMYENATDPARADSPWYVKVGNAAVKSAAEAVIEYTLGRIFGATFSNRLIGMGGSMTRQGLKKTAEQLGKFAGVKMLLREGVQEGAEEFLQDFTTNLIDQGTGLIYEGYNRTGVTFQTLVDSFVIGALTSMLMLGVGSIKTRIQDDISASRINRGKLDKGDSRIFVENEDGSLRQLKGLTKMSYSQIVGDLKTSIEKLQKEKFNLHKNLDLAEKVYAITTNLTQLYKSFSPERIKNAETLLNRVIEAEHNRTKEQIEKNKADLREFGRQIETEVNEMIGGVLKRKALKLKTETSKQLADGNVTKVTSVSTKDENKAKKRSKRPQEPEIVEIEKRLKKKVDELNKDYDFVVTTDGNIAVEQDNYVFVSEAWLENYETSEIYQFLSNQRFVEMLVNDQEFKPLFDTLVSFVQNFTSEQNIDVNRAFMELLFNESVFQAFLLSNKGENLHAFKKILFTIPNILSLYETEASLTEKQRAYAKKTVEQIKQVWRKSIIVAVLNWNMGAEMQALGIDSLLSEADRKYIARFTAKREQNKAVLNGTVPSAYRRRLDNILESKMFNDEQRQWIRENIDNKDVNIRVQAITMADIADNLVPNMYNLPMAADMYNELKAIRDRLRLRDTLIATNNHALVKNTALSILASVDQLFIQRLNYSYTEMQKAIDFDQIDNIVDGQLVLNQEGVYNFFRQVENYVREKIADFSTRYKEGSEHSFVASLSTAAILDKSRDQAQYISDKFSVFENLYGFDPTDFLQTLDTREVKFSTEGRRLYLDKCTEFNLDPENYFTTIPLIIEEVLGNDYQVTATYHQELSRVPKDKKKRPRIVAFQIIARIPASLVFKPDFVSVNEDLVTRNAFIYEQFVNKLTGERQKIGLSTIVNDEFTKKYPWINACTVTLTAGIGTYTDVFNGRINIDPSENFDLLDALSHEINHMFEYLTYVSRGGDPAVMLKENEAVNKYVYDNYKYLVNWYFDCMPYSPWKSHWVPLIRDGKVQYKDLDYRCRSNVAFLAYKMLQGEIISETAIHNGKPVKGFQYRNLIGKKKGSPMKTVLVSPDGKKTFDLPGQTKNDISRSVTKATGEIDNPVYLRNKYIETLENILTARDEDISKDNFHSSLVSRSSLEIMQSLIDPTLSLIEKGTITIENLINNPQRYGNAEIKALTENKGEGEIPGIIQDYIEKKFPDISIDRSTADDANHKWVLVDNRTFDDIVKPELRKERKNDRSDSLVDKWREKTATTNDFYTEKALNDMNAYGIEVIVSDKNKKSEYRNGKIYIKTDSLMTNDEFFTRLNHELRHALQQIHKFEGGFTTNFVVTDEMRKDIKKHVPELFETEWAKTIGEDKVIQEFIYYLVHGEQEAYGVFGTMVKSKPVIVTKIAGKYKILMPWYDGTDGVYETTVLDETFNDKDKTTDTKKVETQKSEEAKENEKSEKKTRKEQFREDFTIEKDQKNIGKTYSDEVTKYKYDQKARYIPNKRAEKSNLKYYIRKGKRIQLSPDIANFIEATTGKEKSLPPEIVYAIQKGKLTEQTLFKWFRDIDLSTMNQETFDLLNEHIFKNDVIKTPQELEKLLSFQVQYWWAVAKIMYRHNLSAEAFTGTNSIDEFTAFLKTLDGSKFANEIYQEMAKFDTYYRINDKTAKREKVEKGINESTERWMRVLAMQYFDGTLAGAFYTANTMRKVIRDFQEDGDKGALSLNATITADADKEFIDMASADITGKEIKRDNFIVVPEEKNILSLYENHIDSLTRGEMIAQLAENAYEHYYNLAKRNYTEKYPDKTAEQIERASVNYAERKTTEYREKLRRAPTSIVTERYEGLRNFAMTGVETVPDAGDKTQKPRTTIVNNIKNRLKRLQALIEEGKVSFSLLPEDVQNMFDEVVVKDNNGREHKVYQYKEDVYKVGRGAIQGKGSVDHDMTQIVENEELLGDVVTDAKRGIYSAATLAKKASAAEEELRRRDRRDIRQIMSKSKKLADKEVKSTEIEVKKPKTRDPGATHEPSVFNIVSPIDMPEKLRYLYQTSFDAMADTQVQFASKDAGGKLYQKDDKEFESRKKHEVISWSKFYEVNAAALLDLTRKDVLDIVEFIQSGATTFNGPANKFNAFNIFLLGYIIDGARRNFNSWNFSDAEIDMIEQLFEEKASALGSGLNAVSQMLNTMNPFRRIYAKYLEDYGIHETELAPMFSAIDRFQNATTEAARNEATENLAKEMKAIEERIAEGDMREKGWGKRWYQKMKSARYTFMLSSPTTWVRNLISNVAQLSLNKAGDFVGRLVLGKKQYRQDQYNLAKAKVSNDVHQFIEDYVKKTGIFDSLYDTNTKYTYTTKGKLNRDMLKTMLSNALEQRYAARHRFDNEVANRISNFVNRMISDKTFIRFVTNRYFGKILTIEVEKGNVDLQHGFTREILQVFVDSMILANEEYMHKRSWVADMIDGLKEKHPLAYEILNWWQPFINSSFNWFAETMKYTPFGLAASIINMSRVENKIAKLKARREEGAIVPNSRVAEYLVRRDIGKGIIGLLMTAFGIFLGLTGRIRIDEEDDKFYMYVGDIKVDISNIFGTSSVLIGASLTQIGKASFTDIMNSAMDYMFEGFFLKDMVDGWRFGNGFWDNIATQTESILKSFIPNFVQLFIRATNNEKIKYSPGIKGMLERWLNSFVPTQPLGDRVVNPYTGEIQTKYALPFFGELLKSGILGPRIYIEEISEGEELSLMYDVRKEGLKQMTVDNKTYQLDIKANQKFGELNKKSLAQIQKQKHSVRMPDGTYKTLSWNQMTDEQRQNVIERTYDKNASYAKIWWWTTVENHKYYANDETYKTLKALGIIRNVYKGDKGFVQ